MKQKIKIVALCLCLAAVSILAPFTMGACDHDPRLIRLSEVTRSVFYAPLYVAMHNGYFDQADIRIELTNAGGADRVMAALISGGADVGLMGPEATVYTHVEGMRDHPVIFGQLTFLDGSFLIGREEMPDFKWSDLEGKHILAGRAGGMPAMTLQYVIENTGGLNLNQLNFDTSVEFNLMVGAFEGDTRYDFVTAFEPVASNLVKNGRGHIVASVGEASGSVPYTAFSAQKSYLNTNRDLLTDFLIAVQKGYDFIKANDALTVAQIVSPLFASTSLELLAASIQRYLNIGAWQSSPVMTQNSFEKLQDIMQNAGHLKSRADFNLVVDNSIAALI
ncbi:MAG: ABC transporter substrate-binding protein [Firmicutes bacterium]|nr:ABC transporter substrate-binding protein [Bacillota bacterium]